jgi:hypothetical protein
LAVLREVEREDAHLVVVDTLRAFAGILDENDAAKVGAAVQPLVLLARRKNIGVIALHHLRKSEGDEGLAHAGSTALVGLVDVALELRRDQHSPARRVVRAVSRFDDTPRALTLELRDGNILALGAPEVVSLGAVAERVLAILTPGQGLTADEVRDGLDPRPSREQVFRALRQLLAEGRVGRSGRGSKGNPHQWEKRS